MKAEEGLEGGVNICSLGRVGGTRLEGLRQLRGASKGYHPPSFTSPTYKGGAHGWGRVSETTQSKMARRLNHLLLLLPAVILADGPGGHHHGAHHGDHHGAHGAHHGAHNADHGHGAAAHHADHGAAAHHPVQHTVVSSSPVQHHTVHR